MLLCLNIQFLGGIYVHRLFIFVFYYQGRKLKCSTSQEKHRLFIGNVPRHWGEEDMKNIVTKIGPGVINVELLKVKIIHKLGFF